MDGKNANESKTETNAPKKAVSAEQAEAEFLMLLEGWGIHVNTDDMTEEDLESFNQQKSRITAALINGSAKYDPDDGTLIYKLKKPANKTETIVFDEPTGAAWIKMGEGGSKKANGTVKINRFLSEAMGVPLPDFAAMKNSDYTFCAAIAVLFLAS